ncbi:MULTISPECIES: transglycosylase domain-containing protein [unclassified Streptomyces]|uniref:transglycosylase domain-containing protein n=1 Tax=unclassified Streptomyces TaxID=2593676 RepID=UPI001CBEF724|nr:MULTISPECIES: transglycosylase domain-containing protein [unclassified Streptomyces]WPO73136.1 transglycosylase domain-containing protein [Streptomyces sp. KN37]
MGIHARGKRVHRRVRRLVDYPRSGRAGVRRWLPSWRQLLGSAGLFALTLTALLIGVYASVDIPDENAGIHREANVYYWSDGTQMVSTGEVNRQNVELDQIAPAAVNAVIAAENETFYDDSGVSPKGLARAAVNMVRGQETQGGSTITQQYVKNTYLSQDQTVTRKVKEFVIALKVDRKKSKEEILEGYLNTSWFGRGANGIEAAAHAYYGIPAEKLDPSQGAFLAAMLKGAELYDPAGGKANRERARGRWAWILDRQVDVGLMSKKERAKHRTFPEPRRQSRSTSLGGQTGYLVDVANKYLKQRTGLTDEELARGGYEIHTTFDKEKVARLERAVRRVLKRDLAPKTRAADRHVQVGAASVRPSDGAVVALYGGRDATEHFSNNADTSGVPVGSAFKPFVLAAALQHGVSAPDSPLAGAEQSVLADSSYAADGTLRRATGGPDPDHPTLRAALYPGGNATYVRLGKDVGRERVRRTAVDAGLLSQSMAPLEPSFSVGTSTPSAIRMAAAYGTFAGGGLRHDPYSVTKAVKDGSALPGLERPAPGRALDEGVAGEVADALRAGGKDLGPGVSAGRTGDQDRLRTAWVTGFTKDLSTAVTVFRVRPGEPRLLPMSGVAGKDSRRGNVLPPRIWAAYAGEK